MFRFQLLPLALILFLHAPTFVSAQVTLKRKFEEGTKFKLQETVKVDQVLKLNNMAIPTKSDTKFMMSVNYGKRDAEGNLPIERKFESLQAEISLPGGLNVKFDSARPNEKASNPALEPALDQFRKLSGLLITYKLSADKKVVSVEKSQPESPVDPDDLKDDYQQDIDMLPNEPVKTGDKWERTVRQDLGQGQVFTFKRNYEYAGQVDEFATVPGSRKLDKITATDASVEYSVKPNAGMGLTVKSSDLKVESSKHTYLFDRTAGRIVDENNEVHITGKLSLSVNNIEIDGDLDLTLATHEQEAK